jgi:hypothetical protein
MNSFPRSILKNLKFDGQRATFLSLAVDRTLPRTGFLVSFHEGDMSSKNILIFFNSISLCEILVYVKNIEGRGAERLHQQDHHHRGGPAPQGQNKKVHPGPNF